MTGMGTRSSGVLTAIETEPLRFMITLTDGSTVSLQLPDTQLIADTTIEVLENVLAPAHGQQVEIELRSAPDNDDAVADIWYHEPIIEDDEVEYTSPCHLRTMLLRARLLSK
jgi:hypothetical protein